MNPTVEFSIKGKQFIMENDEDADLINATVLIKASDPYYVINFEDRLVYAPKPSDKDKMFSHRSISYVEFVRHNNEKILKLLKSIRPKNQ